MNRLTITIELLLGKYVAASVSNREVAEWPPHPGRLFMALAATCFELDEEPKSVKCLEWLEQLSAPAIEASDAAFRSSVKYYVATNDKLVPSKSVLQTTPGLTRSKQERMYPTAIPVEPVVRFLWDVDDSVYDHLDTLSDLCRNVIRVGHSSSLVRVLTSVVPECESKVIDASPNHHRWMPVSGKGRMSMRVPGPGEFRRLKIACKMEHIELFASLTETIETSKGKIQKEAKREFEAAFGIAYSRSVRVPEPSPAVISGWAGYVPEQQQATYRSAIESATQFDSELLILSKCDEYDQCNLTLQDTLALTKRLRDAAMSCCPIVPVPTWLSGHDVLTGRPTKEPHIAIVPLAYVGGSYADGSIKGLAIAFPHRDNISLHDRGQVMGPMLFDDLGEPKVVTLKLGTLGEWKLKLEERPEPPKSLQQLSWIGPSKEWASITPVVLDRFPRSSKSENRQQWEEEVRRILFDSCLNCGYPKPVAIDVDTTSWHRGSPRAYRKKRKLRDEAAVEMTVGFGDGFPLILSRPGKPPRLQIHVRLSFPEPIAGPVLIGAGRFLGYGFLKPIWSNG